MAETGGSDPWWKFCAVCGDRVGIYETVLVEQPDSTIRSSYLKLETSARLAPWRFLDAGCAVLDDAPD